jgi:hypothetical protein
VNPFTDNIWELPIIVSFAERSATIQASLASLSHTAFTLNFASNEVLTYSTSCYNCEGEPNFATEYLDITDLPSDTPFTIGPSGANDGYSYGGEEVYTQFCIENNGINPTYCTSTDTKVLAVKDVISNYWNYNVSASSGTVGLNWNSTLWD